MALVVGRHLQSGVEQYQSGTWPHRLATERYLELQQVALGRATIWLGPEAVARATSWTSVNTSGRKHKNLGFTAADAEKAFPLSGNLFHLSSNHLRGKIVKKAWSS